MSLVEKARFADEKMVAVVLAPRMAAPLIAIVCEYRWYDVAAIAEFHATQWRRSRKSVAHEYIDAAHGPPIIVPAIRWGMVDHIDTMRVAVSDTRYFEGYKIADAIFRWFEEPSAAEIFARLMDEKKYDACVAIYRLFMSWQMLRPAGSELRREMKRMIFAAPDDVVARFISFFAPAAA